MEMRNGNRGTEESASHVSRIHDRPRRRSPDEGITGDNKEDPASTVHPHPRVIKESEDRETPHILSRRRISDNLWREEETEVVRSENSPLLDFYCRYWQRIRGSIFNHLILQPQRGLIVTSSETLE